VDDEYTTVAETELATTQVNKLINTNRSMTVKDFINVFIVFQLSIILTREQT